jgi:hypothetical protein
MQINIISLRLITCVKLTLLDRYGVSFGNLYHRHLAQHLIKIDQNSINSFEGETCVHAYYALSYALYTDYIKIPSLCVIIQRTRFRRHIY